MKVAFGLKSHSGWAVLVVVGLDGNDYQVIDRWRIELIEDLDGHKTKQPYHAAEGLNADAARNIIEHSVTSAYNSAVQEIRVAISRSHELGHEVIACAILVPAPMPDWTIDEILSVHLRMHKAEGVLFPDALVKGAQACGLTAITIPEKQLNMYAERSLQRPMDNLMRTIDVLGKTAGAPWGKDQKSAALVAMIGLHQSVAMPTSMVSFSKE
jgi:hypothetical protein